MTRVLWSVLKNVVAISTQVKRTFQKVRVKTIIDVIFLAKKLTNFTHNSCSYRQMDRNFLEISSFQGRTFGGANFDSSWGPSSAKKYANRKQISVYTSHSVSFCENYFTFLKILNWDLWPNCDNLKEQQRPISCSRYTGWWYQVTALNYFSAHGCHLWLLTLARFIQQVVEWPWYSKTHR